MSMTTFDSTAPLTQVRSRMLTYVERRVRDRSTAEDIVQDVFLRVASNPEAWRAVRDPDAYLFHLTKHAVTDHYRRAQWEVPTSNDTLDQPTHPEPDETDIRQIAPCLVPLMVGLSARDQQALRLIDVNGKTQSAAAHELGLSVSGMKSRVQRARARLRDRLLACCAFETDHRGTPTSFIKQRAGCPRRC